MVDTWADVEDKNGKKTGLSLQSFEKLILELQHPENFDQYKKTPEELYMEIFTAADTDGSGKIDELELIVALRKATGKEPQADVMKKLYAKFATFEDVEVKDGLPAPAFTKKTFVNMIRAIKTGSVHSEHFDSMYVPNLASS